MSEVYLGKLFNEHRFLRSDFRTRLFAYLEDYDNFFGNDVISSAKDWLREGRYDMVRYFLQSSSFEYALPFSLQEFVTMSAEDFAFYNDYACKKLALLDEKKALYKEYITFYEL